MLSKRNVINGETICNTKISFKLVRKTVAINASRAFAKQTDTVSRKGATKGLTTGGRGSSCP